jgi:hypothetical protein
MRAPLLRAALCVLAAAACHVAGAATAGPAPDTPELWAALEALAGPTEPAAADQAVRAARAAARPLAAGTIRGRGRQGSGLFWQWDDRGRDLYTVFQYKNYIGYP